MEAASVPATPPRPGSGGRDFVSKYGLIVVLLAMPVYFGIKDLTGDEGDLSRLGNNLVDGLSNGAIWALVAIGYTLVYGIVELINFAHGEVFMIGSFIAAGFFAAIGLTLDTGTGLADRRADRGAADRDARVGRAQHDDRARRVQAAPQRPSSPR